MNRPFARALLASAAVAAAIALAGCDPDSIAPTGRAHAPLSEKTLAEMTAKNMDKESPILARIFKEEAELEIWKQNRDGQFELLKTYPICRWSGDLGPKKKEGDRQAPEGFYTITPGQMNPNSNYYLAFNTGFPNAYDRAMGYTGSELMVHGDCSSRGCYAMTDEQIQEIYALARESFFGGQKSFQLQAYPFRMTAMNMAKHRNNPNFAFWKMLKEGYDHFDATHQEPKVAVCDRRYVFDAASPDNSTQAVVVQCEGRLPGLSARQERRRRNQRSPAARAAQDGGIHRQRCIDRPVPHGCRRRDEPDIPRQAFATERFRQQRPLSGGQQYCRAWRAAARIKRAGRAAAHRYSHSAGPERGSASATGTCRDDQRVRRRGECADAATCAAAKARRSPRFAANHDCRADRQLVWWLEGGSCPVSVLKKMLLRVAPVPTWQQSQSSRPPRYAPFLRRLRRRRQCTLLPPVLRQCRASRTQGRARSCSRARVGPAVASCQSRTAATATPEIRTAYSTPPASNNGLLTGAQPVVPAGSFNSFR